MPTSSSTSSKELKATSRRQVLTAAAWSVPVIATAVAAPAQAASRVRGIDGWVEVQWDGNRVYLDGRGSYPDRGLWVTDTNPGDTITNATITFYLSVTAVATWTAQGGNDGAWSLPVNIGTSTIAGTPVRGYTTTYNFAAFPVTPVSPITMLNNNLHWRTNTGFGNSLVWARRSVTVNGEVLSFLRGPVSPNNNRRSATPEATAQIEQITGSALL
ncbi:hypothetical protein [Pseudoclavibacter terrae]|uniref:hypothetical protein n=1 Tax=Pseudoclavibacter terrae TaxID=1530195 RepID=UPI00232C1A88|nr:hypothetical protein [Pseudoclavibacter terrae]